MRRKILTALFVLVIVVPQIYTPAYANKVQDKALISAVIKGDVDGAKRLLAAGAKVDAVNQFGTQSIHIAVQIKNIEMLKALLSAGGKVDAVDKSGFQPIHYAALKGNVELVQVLLDAGAKVDAKIANSTVEESGALPLHFAARSGNAELVKILLAAGAKTDATDSKGNTAYSYVFTKGIGNPELVKKLLLAAGAKQTLNLIDDMKPIWRLVAEPQIKLGLWDKIVAKQNFIAKYIVKCEVGAVFAAEKTANANNPESSEVLFPRDFHYALKGMESHQASACGEGKNGTKFTWDIYADDVLIYSGTMIFTAKLAH